VQFLRLSRTSCARSLWQGLIFPALADSPHASLWFAQHFGRRCKECTKLEIKTGPRECKSARERFNPTQRNGLTRRWSLSAWPLHKSEPMRQIMEHLLAPWSNAWPAPWSKGWFTPWSKGRNYSTGQDTRAGNWNYSTGQASRAGRVDGFYAAGAQCYSTGRALQKLALDTKPLKLEHEAEVLKWREKVPAPILGHFDRLIARGKKGVAIARNGACGECHLRLPSGTMGALAYTNEVHLCDNCGRYLPENSPHGVGLVTWHGGAALVTPRGEPLGLTDSPREITVGASPAVWAASISRGEPPLANALARAAAKRTRKKALVHVA